MEELATSTLSIHMIPLAKFRAIAAAFEVEPQIYPDENPSVWTRVKLGNCELLFFLDAAAVADYIENHKKKGQSHD
jgi:hypothetical protein